MEMSAQRSLAAIVFTDAVGFSAVASADEKRALVLIEADHTWFRTVCEANNGEVVKTMGDGMLMIFSSAIEALDASVEIHKGLSERAPDSLRHRIGVHVGDMYLTEDDVKGEGVNVAARLQAGAPANGIWVSGAVYELVRSRYAGRLAPVGSKSLKNITEPVSVYEFLPEGIHRPTVVPSTKRTTLYAGLGLGMVALFAGGIAIGRGKAPERPKGPEVVSSVQTPASEAKIELTQEQWAAIAELLSQKADANRGGAAINTDPVSDVAGTASAPTKPNKTASVSSGSTVPTMGKPATAKPGGASSPAPPKPSTSGVGTVAANSAVDPKFTMKLPNGLPPDARAELDKAFSELNSEEFEKNFAMAFNRDGQRRNVVHVRSENPAESLAFLKRGYEFDKLIKAYELSGADKEPTIRAEIEKLGGLMEFRTELSAAIKDTKDLKISTSGPMELSIRDGKIYHKTRAGKEIALPLQALHPWQMKRIAEELSPTHPKLENGIKMFSTEFGLKKE